MNGITVTLKRKRLAPIINLPDSRWAKFASGKTPYAIHLLLVGAMLSGLSSGCKKNSIASNDNPAPMRETVPPVTPPTSKKAVDSKQVQPAAHVKMTDDEILASDKLTFQEKRSRLYVLAESAVNSLQETVRIARNLLNYQRTRQRLSGWRVKFTPEAEQEFIGLTDRVEKGLNVASAYYHQIESKLDAARQVEPALLDMIRDGSIDPNVRQQYLSLPNSIRTAAAELGFIKAQYQDVPYLNPVTTNAQKSLLRWQVDCGILFDELVAARSSQELMRAAGEIDALLSRVLSSLPEAVTSEAGFCPMGAPQLKAARDVLEKTKANYQKAKDRKVDLDNELEVAGQLNTLECELRDAERRLRRAESQMTVGVEMAAAERRAFIDLLEKDASVLERALEGRLLDYPWPWPVQRVKVDHQPFIVTTKETP